MTISLTELSCITHPSNKAIYDATMLFSMCLPALCNAEKDKKIQSIVLLNISLHQHSWL